MINGTDLWCHKDYSRYSSLHRSYKGCLQSRELNYMVSQPKPSVQACAMYQSFAVGSHPGGCRRPAQVGCRWTHLSVVVSSGPGSCAEFCWTTGKHDVTGPKVRQNCTKCLAEGTEAKIIRRLFLYIFQTITNRENLSFLRHTPKSCHLHSEGGTQPCLMASLSKLGWSQMGRPTFMVLINWQLHATRKNVAI